MLADEIWSVFTETGNILFYLLYKDLTDKTEEMASRKFLSADKK